MNLRLALLATILLPGALRAQFQEVATEYQRSNSAFRSAFKEVAKKIAPSTVQVLADGKEVALGVAVDSDGYILTKAHDLHGTLTCRANAGRKLDARLVAVHPEHDLALLKIDAQGLLPIEWTDSKTAAVGEWIACVGTGDIPVSIGVLSVAARKLPTSISNPFAQGYLGVAIEPAETGIKIKEILPNTAASAAGLQADDLLLILDGTAITGTDHFIEMMTPRKPGEMVALKIQRAAVTMELKITLGRRPSQNRGDFQNRLGSELSSRTVGYTTILQHDAVVLPQQCGSALVDLDGRVLGLTICRAGRTETWAIPSEIIKPLIAEMKAGKFPPPGLIQAVALETPAKKSQPEKTDRLLSLMEKRLALMEQVARVKWTKKIPIEDREREKSFLNAIAERALAQKLPEQRVRDFFRGAN